MKLGTEQYKVVISFHDEMTDISEYDLTPTVVLQTTNTDGTFEDNWYKEIVSGVNCYLYVMDSNNQKYYLYQNDNQRLFCSKNNKQMLAFYDNSFIVMHEKITLRLGISYDELTGCHYLGMVPTSTNTVNLLDI